MSVCAFGLGVWSVGADTFLNFQYLGSAKRSKTNKKGGGSIGSKIKVKMDTKC